MPTTTTFTYTGSPQTFTVPARVTSVTVDGWGAGAWQGGDPGGEGALGGRIQCTLPVTPGETLHIYIGGTPLSQTAGGWNGGGSVALTTHNGGAGGGATDIRRGGHALANRVYVAPGGGGRGAAKYDGGILLQHGGAGGVGGGLTGGAGTALAGSSSGGGGGTQSAGGAGGQGGSSIGEAGSLGVGGRSAVALVNGVGYSGGGGGGGFYGGGGGAAGSAGGGDGGGGGSALTPAGGTTSTATQVVARMTLTYNQPPSSPLLLTPPDGRALNRDAPARFSWQHVDPDGDGQNAYTLRYRQLGQSWVEVFGGGPNQLRDFPAGTFADGDYEWQVITSDQFGAVGSWSSSCFFTAASAPVGAAITSPISGETIGAASVEVVWTGDGVAYRVRSVADESGVAVLSQVLYDSGERFVDANGRRWTVPLPVNSRYEHIVVEERNADGLWQAVPTAVRILVSYTLPSVALGSVVPVQTFASEYVFDDALALTMTSPAPTGGQPDRSHLNVHVEALDPGDRYRPQGVLTRIATQQHPGVFTDYAVVSGCRYGYRIETVAVNGTTSMSDLITGPADVDGGGPPPAEDPFDPTFSATF